MTDSPPTLWNFAISVYEQPDIAALCLHLQDHHDFDVNLLLYCLWHGQYWGAVDEAQLDQALDYSRQWQAQVVTPLRETRRWLKQQLVEEKIGREETGSEGLYTLREQIKACELAGERQQLETLEAMLLATVPRQPASSTSLADTRGVVINNLTQLRRRMTNESEPADNKAEVVAQALAQLADCYCQPG